MNTNMTHLDAIKNRMPDMAELKRMIARWRLLDKKIVFTNGCFDILHYGHIDYLSKAADFGDVLIVGVNSDESVKKLNKGASRPIQNEQSRLFTVASLHFVSVAILFNEDTPLNLITEIQPDVIVKGGDYKDSEIAGADVVKARGGEVKIVDFVQGYSTTDIEKRIKTN